MPELPEVEVSRIGLLPHLAGSRITGAVARVTALRRPLPESLAARLAGRRLNAIERRGKYLLLDCDAAHDGGWLLLHLGMSGSLRLVPPGTPPAAHDHFDLIFERTILRLRDPRRFGVVDWIEGDAPERHPLLRGLGIEPLAPGFDGDWLHAALALRTGPIKPVLMDSHLVVGIGNIYAAESLFRAGISPRRAANRIARARCHILAQAIRDTLTESIALGGSSVRDYVHSDGGAGCFQLSCRVYGREGLPCTVCGTGLLGIRQAGRATCYCPRCQR